MFIRESLIYDLNSLVGEVGGSLGLFLGMSLVALYKRIFKIAGELLPGCRSQNQKKKKKKVDAEDVGDDFGDF